MKKKYSVTGTKFVDENGNHVILHGINMVCKEKGRNYIGDYTKEDFIHLKHWGFNIIRLGLFWDGVEPTPGEYNEAYLSEIDRLISLAAEQDIAVYLDMHQDLFSADYSDGAPGWATLTEGLEHIETELWSESYLISPAVQVAFDRFWSNEKAADGVGIQDHFIRMWQHLAKRYRDNPYVIGYDVFNEPFLGTCVEGVMGGLLGALGQLLASEGNTEVTEELLLGMWMDQESKLALLNRFSDHDTYQMIVDAIAEIPQEFDRTALSYFYQSIGSAIRSVDPKTLVFLEANYFSNAGVTSAILPFHDEHGIQDPYQVFAPHGYDLMVDTSLYDSTDFTRLAVIFERHRQVQETLGLPTLVGEWGCFPNANEAQIKQAEYLLQLYSGYLMSDTYYDFSHIRNNPVLKALIRPYPMSVAGELLSYHYDDTTKEFVCCIKENSRPGQSMIFLPDIHAVQKSGITIFGSSAPDYELRELGEAAGYLILHTNGAGEERELRFRVG